VQTLLQPQRNSTDPRFAPQFLIGVDEVGRGCLAGPVCAAAVVFPSSFVSNEFKDSKLLRPAVRTNLSERLQREFPHAIGLSEPAEIDEINILQASLLAMKRAVEGLLIPEGRESEYLVLVDGKFSIPGLRGFLQKPVIQGDRTIQVIGAASILAKVYRDEAITRLGQAYPAYGFEKHKAYPTAEHKAALRRWGPTPHHRRSFAGVTS
jgi:ribonuclease HII